MQSQLGTAENRLRKSEATALEWKSKFDHSEAEILAANEQIKSLTSQVCVTKSYLMTLRKNHSYSPIQSVIWYLRHTTVRSYILIPLATFSF